MKLICQFRMPTSYLQILLIGGGLILAGSTARAQSTRPTTLLPGGGGKGTISVTSELVVLPVNVTDINGNFVPGLNENNFRVYEDKRLQDLTLFQQEDSPVSVGLVVDHSGSMELKLPNVIAAISAFAHSGNPEDDMFVVDFNDNVVTEPLDGKPFTNNPAELEKAVGAVSAHGRTALYDAVVEGLSHLSLTHLQRKALVVISDGGDNASHCKRSEVLALARQSQVTIYSIVLQDEVTKEQDPKLLRQLSEDTGGVAFSPASQQAVVDSSAQIAVDLRNQYVLGFVPEKHHGRSLFRKVQVKVTTPEKAKLHVRTRTGYSAASERAALAEVDEKAVTASLSSEGRKANASLR